MPALPQTKIIRRRKKIKRNPNTTSDAHYFTMETQEAIVLYQSLEDPKEKEVLYVKQILPAFSTLVENLINVYGFKVQHDSKDDLRLECLEFLYTAVPKFRAETGSKAFSYFNVVSRNWLTVKSKQNSKRNQQYISLDDIMNISSVDLEKIESHNTIPSYDEVVSQQEIRAFLEKTISELEGRTKTPNEEITVRAIRDIMSNLDDLELLSKRAVLLYIREITGLSSKNLSIALASLKKHYKEIKAALDQE